MGSRRRRKGKGQASAPLTLEQMKAKKDAEIMAGLTRDARKAVEAKRAENWGINTQAMALPQNATVERRQNKRGKVSAAWKSNPFHCLVTARTLEEDEGRAGEDMMAIYAASKGLDGAPEYRMRLTTDEGDGWGKEDRKQYFIKLWGRITGRLTRSSAAIIEALCFAFVEEDRPGAWGGIVQRTIPSATTGPRQSERVKMMAEELVAVVPIERKELRAENDRKGQAA